MTNHSTPDQRRTEVALLRAIPTLSPAELKVCLLILQEQSTRAIAGDLGVSERTIHNHRYNIRKKIGGEGNLLVELMKRRGD